MTYRKFNTATWQDSWFEELSPHAKLAFIYFWTNEFCNQAGVYEISERRISFDLGYGIDTIYSEINTKIHWYPAEKIVHVLNFFKRQCQNSKFAISAINSVKSNLLQLKLFIDYNRDILEGYSIDLSPYHMDTISIPYPTEQNRTEQNRADIKKQVQGFALPSNEILKDGAIRKINHDIDKACEKLYQEKIFPTVHKFKNKMLKEGKNERAILHALSRCYIARNKIKGDAWGYCIKIMQVENGNYNESDYGKTA